MSEFIESSQSSSQASTTASSEPVHSNSQMELDDITDDITLDDVDNAPLDETLKPIFEEVEIGGQTFSLVPKELVHFVPTAPVTIQEINGIGPVEVGSDFMYIPTTLLPEIKELISKSVDLQRQVCLFRELLWTRYCHSDKKPPFDPHV